MGSKVRGSGPLIALVVAVSCGGDAGNRDAEPEPAAGVATAVARPAREVVVTQPAEGDVVAGPSVIVFVGARGFTVVAAGDTTPNSGHLHLFLDRDLSPAGQPIPTEPGHIIHIGTGGIEYTFDAVAPGRHRLIAVVGDALHFPLQPWVVDTVHFTVR